MAKMIDVKECQQTNQVSDQYVCRQITIKAQAVVKLESSIELWGKCKNDQYWFQK